MKWGQDDKIFITGCGVPNASARTLWPMNSIIPSPGGKRRIYTVSSSDANDALNGAGAWYAFVHILDYRFKPVLLTIDLDGQNPVELPDTVMHVNSVEIASAGSNGTNLGAVYVGTGTVTAGVPAEVYEVVPIGLGASQSLRYTVPEGEVVKVDEVILDASSGITDYIARLCVTKDGITRVIGHGLAPAFPYEFKAGETLSIQTLGLTGSGTIYGYLKGTTIDQS